jgi:hypothetical protein
LTDRAGSDIDPADPEQLLLPSLLSGAFFCHGLASSEELAACRDDVFALSVCQQAEVTYPHKTFRQYVKQEPSDKFISLERHGLFAVIVCIISPEKCDIAIPVVEDAVIADGDPVGISAKVLKDTFGAIEGWFAIDNPLLLIELFSEDLEVPGLLEMAEAAGEYKIIRREAFTEKGKELTPEQRRHDPDRNEKILAAWHPAASVGGKSATGDNTVDMGMIHKVLPPGVQNPDGPYPCAKMLRIIGELHERLGNGSKKKIIHDLPVHRYQAIQFRGDGEDHMEVPDGKKILTAGFDPSLLP